MSQKFNILLIEDSRIDSTKLLNRNVIATVSNKRLELVIDGKHRTEFKLKQLKISTNYTRNSCIITSDGLKLVMSDRSDVAKRFVKHLQDAIDGKLCDPSISNSNSSANYHKSDQKIYSNSDRSSQKRSGVADRNSLGNSHSKGSSTSGSASAKRIQQSETTVSSSRKAELSIDESPHNLKNVNSSAVKTSPIVSNYTDKNSNSANKSNSGKLLMKRKSDEFEMVITSPMKSYKRKLSAVSRTDDSDDDNIDEISAKKDNNSTNSTEKKDKDPLDDLQMDVVEPTQVHT